MSPNSQLAEIQDLELSTDRADQQQPSDPIDEPCPMCLAEAGEPCRLSCMPYEPYEPDEPSGA